EQPVGVVGTPYYVAPEIVRGLRPTPASDIYSMAATLWHLLTGAPPFDGAMREILNHHVRGRLPSITSIRADLPQPMALAIHRALAKNPSDRFESIKEFADALRAAARLSGSTSQLIEPIRSRYSTTRSRLSLFGASVLAIGGIAYAASRLAFEHSRDNVSISSNESTPNAPPRGIVTSRFEHTQVDRIRTFGNKYPDLSATVSGTVIAAERSASGKSVTLRFDRRADGFYIVFYSALYEDMTRAFGDPYAESLLGKRINVDGVVHVVDNQPRMFLRNVSQIRPEEPIVQNNQPTTHPK
ncbi:MAG TPA: hypothetical protein PK402_02165, partial [Tepidisphaeraceae bacterium]|nr:hypothetical protein [Tepidisphaeraceae bacterium]